MSDNSPPGQVAPDYSPPTLRQLAPNLTLCELVKKSAFYLMQC